MNDLINGGKNYLMQGVFSIEPCGNVKEKCSKNQNIGLTFV